jgi:transcriptional regulator with XRE-family HTH domain
MKTVSILAHNIKTLRKFKGWSQEALALKLDVKRSNIAAYEAKNVEPRLRIILKMADLFQVSINTLITQKLKEEDITANTNSSPSSIDSYNGGFNSHRSKEVSKFLNESKEIRKILEGFKALYQFKKNNQETSSIEKERLRHDIESFIQLIDHLSSHNESIIHALHQDRVSTTH